MARKNGINVEDDLKKMDTIARMATYDEKTEAKKKLGVIMPEP